jgi:Werner syndrome ATP-dependent helicase
MGKYQKTLKKWFGFDDFRKNQLNIIQAVIEDYQDACVIMFTGAGKSLCYQFPPIHTNTTCLVISPLISLMNDQKLKLEELNIPSCCLNSSVNWKNELKDEILANKYRLVYTTPEYITKQEDFVRQLYDNNVLSLVAIDEAHVVSTWAQDFRESYKKLNCIREWAPDVPIIALTATATHKVQRDIIKNLELEDPLIVKSTFDRPNLNIQVMPKGLNALQDIMQVIVKDEPTIIYCQTRKLTEKIAKQLTKSKIISKSYHAGMKPSIRKDVHEDFSSGKLNCVVATIAFGMGIDIVIRKVIHYGMAKDMESYYQEIGRAGRDGKPSDCYMFYALSDMNSINYFLSLIQNTTYKNHMMQLSLIMKNYIFSSECRRRYILEYFGEIYKKDNCKNCDNCLSDRVVQTYDFGKDASKLFNTMNLTGNCYGKLRLINILRGSNSKKIHQRFKNSDQFGKGRNHSEQWWKIFITMLINNKYIKEKPITGGRAFTLTLAKKSSEWLGIFKIKSGTTMILKVPETMLNLMPNQNKIPEQIIAEEIEDMIEEAYRTPTKRSSNSFEKSYNIFEADDKKTIKQIALELKLNPRTVEDHLVKAYDYGKEVDLSRLGLTDDIYKEISKKTIQLKYPKKISIIKKSLPTNISYLQIKLSLAKLNKKNANQVIIVKKKKKVIKIVTDKDNIMDGILDKKYYVPNKEIEDEYINLLK